MSRPRSAGTWRTAERGSATVETALVLPVIVAMVAALVVTAVIGARQVAVTEGARAAARALAIGHSEAEAQAIAQQVCQCGADVTLSEGAWVDVTVTASSAAVSWLGGIRVSARITLPREPGGQP